MNEFELAELHRCGMTCLILANINISLMKLSSINLYAGWMWVIVGITILTIHGRKLKESRL